jgi:hypothetical protein
MPGEGKVLRRNPLQRRSDRIQAWSAFLTIMTLLLASPWSAWQAARMTYRDEVRAGEWERQHRFQVPAVLLEDPPAAVGSQGPPTRSAAVLASWVSPDGVARTGSVPVEPGRRSGSTQTIWVDDDGDVAAPPLRRNPAIDAFLTAVFIALALLAGLGGLHRAVVWRLDQRRLRDWQTEWSTIEPLWRHR